MKESKSTGSKAETQVKQSLSKTNPSLERLGVLAGDWDNIEVSNIPFYSDPATVLHGHASFQWTEDGAFLVEYSEPPSPDFPRGTAIIGPDDAAGTYCMLYFDSRGVSRIYQMSLNGNSWKLWRDFPDFAQRFTGVISEDGQIIKAKWEKSSGGSQWEHDFDLTYTRVKQV